VSARCGPGDSNAGPVAGDRRTADKRSGQLDDTTDRGQAATRRAVPAVSGVVEVDLSRHVDRGGYVHSDARAAVHRALVTLPPGVAVRVRLGRAVWVGDPVLDLLGELLEGAACVEVVGSDERGVAYVVPRLCDRLEVAA
jgi:hypothetical protein